jgi:hypothetical protein
MAAYLSDDKHPSRAARAYAAFDWASPSAMLDAHDFAPPFAPTSPDTMIFGPLDDIQPNAVFPRTGTLDWEPEPIAAYTHLDHLGLDDSDLDHRGSYYLSETTAFSGASSWDVGSTFTMEPPLTPDSPAYSIGDSYGVSSGIAPFSPPSQLASSLPNEHPFTVGQPPAARTRSSVRIPARRTNTHNHSQSFSSHLRTSVASPSSRPTLHMRAMSHSAAMLTRPTNLSMSPRTLRNSTLDAALAHVDTPLHFHHVIATPYSTSAPSRPPAPITIGSGKSRRSSSPSAIDPDQTLSAGEEDPSRKRKLSPEAEQAADLGMDALPFRPIAPIVSTLAHHLLII